MTPIRVAMTGCTLSGAVLSYAAGSAATGALDVATAASAAGIPLADGDIVAVSIFGTGGMAAWRATLDTTAQTLTRVSEEQIYGTLPTTDLTIALMIDEALLIAAVTQEAGQSLPARPDARVVHWYSWTEPTISGDHPYDQWFEIPEIVDEGVPAAFTSGQWSLAASGTSGQLQITITALPAANPSISDLEYRLDGGTAVSLSATTTGTYNINSLTNYTEYDVEIRAVNAQGSGAWSDLKAATPTVSPHSLASFAASWYANDIAQSDNTDITNWPDGSGNSRPLNVVGGNPKYRTSLASLNNHPGVTLDGTDDYLATTAEWLAADGTSTVIVAAIADDAVEIQSIAERRGVRTGDAPNLATSHTVAKNLNGTTRLYSGALWEPGVTIPTTVCVLIYVGNGTSSVFRLNGSESTGNAGTESNTSAFYLGRRTTDADRHAQMEIAFVGTKAAAFTAQEISDIEAWAAAKYGITLA